MSYLIIRNPKSGASYAVPDDAAAARLYPDFDILGYENGSPYLVAESGADSGVGSESAELANQPEGSTDSSGDDGSAGELTGFLDAAELGKLKRSELEELAGDMGVEDADDKAVYPNIESLIAKVVTIPVTAPANDDDE